LNMNVARVGRAPTTQEVHVLRRHRHSIRNVCVRLDYRWVVNNAEWLHHCLRLGRNVELRLTGLTAERRDMLGVLQRVAPLYLWREVGMKDVSTLVTGVYFEDWSLVA